MASSLNQVKTMTCKLGYAASLLRRQH